MSDSTLPSRLEIGAGENPLAGEWQRVGYQHLWGYSPLPFVDATFDEVYCSHVLEHIPWHMTIGALKEVHRILRPGGTFEVWVPNFAYIIRCYLDGKCGDSWRRYNAGGDPMLWLNGRIFTYGPGSENWHRACFDGKYLSQCLRDAGFQEVQIIPERIRGTSHGPIDLGASAIA